MKREKVKGRVRVKKKVKKKKIEFESHTCRSCFKGTSGRRSREEIAPPVILLPHHI